MRMTFHLPKIVLRKRRCYCAAVILIFLMLSGCCIECKDKPGVVVHGDWSLELNRSRAIERISEWAPCDSGEEYSSSGLRKKKKGHHAPCGKWGCLICALGPNAGENDAENEEEESQRPLTVTPPQYMGQQYPWLYPNPFYPGLPHPGISPLYAGVPGQGTPFGGFAPQPVPVINPRTGQQHFMQPVMPGQPGVLMLHAQNGQPVMVNPNIPAPLPPPSPYPGMPPAILAVRR